MPTLARLRRYLITGLIVIAPIFVTVFALVWLFQTLDGILGSQVRGLIGREVPGVGLVALILLLFIIGWVSQKAAGRRLVAWGNSILSRFPLTRKIYNASSQIVQSVLDREEKLFQGVALIEYPMAGSYSLVFVTAQAPAEVEGKLGGRAVSVFLPTVPNPTTGYLLVLPASRVQMLDMTVEEGIRMVVSAGVAVPGGDRARVTGLDLKRLLRETGAVPGPRPPRPWGTGERGDVPGHGGGSVGGPRTEGTEGKV